MDKTEIKALELKKEICLLPSYIQYQKSLEALKKHSNLFEMMESVMKMQKEIVIQKKNAEEDVQSLIDDYKNKRDFLLNHPLVVNYLNDREELENDLKMIKNQIEQLLASR